MVGQGRLVAVVVSFLIAAVLVVDCGAGGTRNNDGRGVKGGTVTTEEETTAPEAKRSKAQTAQEPAGFDEQLVAPPGQANVPRGFGGGSLWATGFQPIPAACDDVVEPGEDPCSASASASASASPAAGAPLARVEPRTGEVVATIPIQGLWDAFTQVVSGAGSVWVSSGYYETGPAPKRGPGDVVFRIDPQTNRVVDRIPVDPPTGLAFGHGSVWATSISYGTVSRIDPRTGEVVAKIKVGRGAADIEADEGSGAVWVASSHLPKDFGGYDWPKYSEDNNLTRIDPETNRVVAEIPIETRSRYGGGAWNVAAGEGAVWVLSGDGNLLKVDPATDEVAARVPLGVVPTSYLAVYGGWVWAMGQAEQFRLVRVDPHTMRVVASEDIGPIPKIGEGGLAAGGGYVWFSSGEGLARVAP